MGDFILVRKFLFFGFIMGLSAFFGLALCQPGQFERILVLGFCLQCVVVDQAGRFPPFLPQYDELELLGSLRKRSPLL